MELLNNRNIMNHSVGSTYNDILEDVKNNQSIFITGKAGSGKTFILNRLYEDLNGSCEIRKTASTGIAAYGIEGVTINSFIGYGTLSSRDILNKSKRYYSTIRKIMNGRYATEIRKCTHLIIEEISMIDNVTLEFIEYICRKVRNNEEFMGGICLILCGDLLQLRPISCKDNENDYKTINNMSIFSTNVKIHYLTTNYRQSDRTFIDLLNRVRIGKITADDRKLLKTRVFPDSYCDKIDALELFGNNRQVDAKNKKELDKINSKLWTYHAVDSCSDKQVNRSIISRVNNKNMMYKEILTVKTGCRVMLLKNLNVQEGIVNGSLGVVLKADSSSVMVKFDNGIIKVIERDIQTYYDIEYKSTFSRSQIPLNLAYACTIHKSQGLTLDKCILSLDSSNIYSGDFGKVYVALSRCRDLSGIYIRKITFKTIVSDQEVVEWYESLRKYIKPDKSTDRSRISID